MIDLVLVGIGSGNPDHLTLQAIKALNRADLVLIPQKGSGKADLAELRRTICADVITNPETRLIGFDLPVRDDATPDYRQRVADWHQQIAAIWSRNIRAHLGTQGRVALLVWGDPSLYDSTLRIAALLDMPVAIEVIPGITSLQALTAAHAIPINDIAAPFMVTTGRKLREDGWPVGVDTLAVMLDGDCAFGTLPTEGIHIWWAAYAGMPEQIAIEGPLASAAPRIRAARNEARAAHGWIMDIYVLRRGR